MVPWRVLQGTTDRGWVVRAVDEITSMLEDQVGSWDEAG
jgi:hypothetical protein